MTIDCPCGTMHDASHCPKCGRKARLAYTDEAHDHYPEDAYDDEDNPCENEDDSDYESEDDDEG